VNLILISLIHIHHISLMAVHVCTSSSSLPSLTPSLFHPRLIFLRRTGDECHQLATVRRSCVHNTWRSHRWQRWIQILHATPSIGGSLSGYCHNVWCQETWILWLPDCENFFKVMFTSFVRIHERDRQTNRWTDTTLRHGPRFFLASRGKNQ